MGKDSKVQKAFQQCQREKDERIVKEKAEQKPESPSDPGPTTAVREPASNTPEKLESAVPESGLPENWHELLPRQEKVLQRLHNLTQKVATLKAQRSETADPEPDQQPTLD